MLIVIKYTVCLRKRTTPRKCCATNCNVNYDNYLKEKVFRISKNKEEREKWLKIISRDNTPDSKNTVVCQRHWSKSYETILYSVTAS